MEQKTYLIGLVGKSGHGKDYTAYIIKSCFERIGQSCQLTSWAQALRKLLNQLTGIPVQSTYSEPDKAHPIKILLDDDNTEQSSDKAWIITIPTVNYIKEEIGRFLSQFNMSFDKEKIEGASKYFYNYLLVKKQEAQMSCVRQLLQILGTEVMRNHISPDIWIDILIAKWNKDGRPNTVITDCRFPNEYSAVKKYGTILRIVRRDLISGKIYINPKIDANHASETSLDHLAREMETLENDLTVNYDIQVMSWVNRLIG